MKGRHARHTRGLSCRERHEPRGRRPAHSMTPRMRRCICRVFGVAHSRRHVVTVLRGADSRLLPRGRLPIDEKRERERKRVRPYASRVPVIARSTERRAYARALPKVRQLLALPARAVLVAPASANRRSPSRAARQSRPGTRHRRSRFSCAHGSRQSSSHRQDGGFVSFPLSFGYFFNFTYTINKHVENISIKNYQMSLHTLFNCIVTFMKMS